MRKILTIALVALMAASLFAGVKTSGYVQGAVHMDIDDGEDIVLNPKDDSNKAQININDENKVWGTTITIQNAKNFGLSSKTWLDVMKVAKVEGDFSAKVTFLTFDKITGLSAYTNNADEVNVWRCRTELDGHGVNFDFGYGKYVKAQLGTQIYQDAITADNREDKNTTIGSVLVTPVDGVKVAAGFRLYDFDFDKAAISGTKILSSAWGFNAEADVAKLADLDFSLAAGVAYGKIEGGDDDGYMTVQVFGEYEGINGYVELGVLGEGVKDYAKLGAGYAFSEQLDANAYLTFFDYTDIDFEANVVVGAECNYSLNKQVSFYGNVEYEAKNFDVEGRIKVKF